MGKGIFARLAHLYRGLPRDCGLPARRASESCRSVQIQEPERNQQYFGAEHCVVLFADRLRPGEVLHRQVTGFNLCLFGRTNRSQSGYRYLFTVMSITYPLACWYGYTRPIPRRIHTEIICDYGEDGTYVRFAYF